MAPALVKQCTAKERDSISRKIFDLSYIPPLSIACFDQVGRPCINRDKLFVRQLYKTDHLTNKFDPFMNERDSKMPLPDLFQKQATSSNDIDIMNKKAGSFEHIQENISAVNPKSCNLIANKDKSSANCQQINHKQSNPSTTSSEALISRLNEKQCQIQLKLTRCNNEIIGLQDRLRNFQFCSLRSHAGESVGTTLNSSEYQSSHDSANCKQQIGSKESILSKPVETIKPRLKRIYDTIHYTWDEETDNEELDEDYKCRIPVGRGKKRSENLPPNPEQLYQWKQKRTEVGAKCTWLTIQIANLDKKISSISKLHSQLKQQRKTANKTPSLQLLQNNLSNGGKEEIIQNAIEETNQIIGGSSRTQPIAKPTIRHKYIHALKTTQPSKSEYSVCRNNASILPCQVCTWMKHNSDNGTLLTADMLDSCYHTPLSYNCEVGLSLLMEETLRKERINTKVTITKLKKKKKQKQKSVGQPQNDSIPKIPSQDSKSTQAKGRSERVRSDDVTRKRTHASDISKLGRLRKLRRVSETLSYDGSKPPTPTHELSSPVPQGAGFFNQIKQKKKTTSGDFDINNIVIPYSMAASTRLERIQYKEIPTPGWRNIWNDTNLENGVEEELTDDEVYLERHDRCEMNEQKRFTGYFPPNKRMRINRSSECATSEPPSPMMLDEIKSCQATPIDSPSGLNSSTKPVNRLANLTPCLDNERDPSWNIRIFPLPENEAKKMEPRTPAASPLIGARETSSLTKPLNTYSLRQSPYTLISSTSTTPKNTPKEISKTSSVSTVSKTLPQTSLKISTPGDVLSDLNVKNWTVKLIEESVQDVIANEEEDSQKKGIVLKLAKK